MSLTVPAPTLAAAGESAAPGTTELATAAYTIRREIYPLRPRTLTVKRVASVTPRMRRVTLAGEDLADFRTEAFDNHVKLLIPPGDAPLIVPSIGPAGIVWPDGPRPALRDYSLRRFDRAAGELDIDFVLHAAGAATQWAASAAPGDRLTFLGPRGAFIVPTRFHWHLLVGDETALPAMGRRLEELPADTHALVLCEVEDAAERQALASAARCDIHWLERRGAPAGEDSRLLAALRDLALPSGPGYAWVACEGQVAKRLRLCLAEQHRQPKEWLKASAYWHGHPPP